MSACERAVWEDAEGHIQATPTHRMIRTVQNVPEPIQDYCDGAIADGVRCRVNTLLRKPTPTRRESWIEYRAEITGLVDIAKEIKLTEHYRRHPQKIKQMFQSCNETCKTSHQRRHIPALSSSASSRSTG